MEKINWAHRVKSEEVLHGREEEGKVLRAKGIKEGQLVLSQLAETLWKEKYGTRKL